MALIMSLTSPKHQGLISGAVQNNGGGAAAEGDLGT